MIDKTIKVLLIEDNPGDARLIREMFNEAGAARFELARVQLLEEGLRRVGEGALDVVLLDLGLPDSQGIDTFVRMHGQVPRVPIVVLTGLADEALAVETIREGAQDYLVKGQVDSNLLERSVRYAVERKQAEEALRKSEASLAEAQRIAHLGNWDWDIERNELRWSHEIYRIFGLVPQEFGATYEAFLNSVHPDDREFVKESVDKALYENEPYSIEHRIVLPDGSERIVHEQAEVFLGGSGRPIRMIGTVQDITERKRAEEELQRTLEKLRKALGGTIQALALTVETRDPYTAGHQRRAANLARAIATKMGLSEEQIDGIRMAGVVHDLGKISVPTGILNKPGRLTENEFAIIQTHAQVAYDILKTIEFPWPIAEIVLQHHERIDGSGYPTGLKGDEIMLEARILAVADVVEAMSSHRPYRPAHSIDEALEEIRQNRGMFYDPEVVGACLSLFSDEGFELEHA